jgi:choloylglycine hydrolase
MCTHLSLFSSSSNSPYAISVRAMDFAIDLHTRVSVVPRGMSFPAPHLFESSLPNEVLKWQNKYGYVGMATGWSHSPETVSITDGINEKGLTIGELWLAGSQYPSWKSATTPLILNTYFSQWVLGNFDSVQSLKQALDSVTVVNISEFIPAFIKDRESALRLPLHFAISDSTGANLIIEFTNGQMQTYDSDNGVMTNAPPYPYHLDNLTNYVNLSLKNNPQQFWGQEINGSGCLGMPGDYSPPSRFVRAWMLQQTTQHYTPTSTAEAVGLAARVLQNFATPKGSITSGENQQLDNTQFGTIRDQKNRVYYFFTQFNNNLFSIDLKKIDFSKVSFSSLPIVQTNWVTDLTEELLKG